MWNERAAGRSLRLDPPSDENGVFVFRESDWIDAVVIPTYRTPETCHYTSIIRYNVMLRSGYVCNLYNFSYCFNQSPVFVKFFLHFYSTIDFVLVAYRHDLTPLSPFPSPENYATFKEYYVMRYSR